MTRRTRNLAVLFAVFTIGTCVSLREANADVSVGFSFGHNDYYAHHDHHAHRRYQNQVDRAYIYSYQYGISPYATGVSTYYAPPYAAYYRPYPRVRVGCPPLPHPHRHRRYQY